MADGNRDAKIIEAAIKLKRAGSKGMAFVFYDISEDGLRAKGIDPNLAVEVLNRNIEQGSKSAYLCSGSRGNVVRCPMASFMPLFEPERYAEQTGKGGGRGA